MTNIRSRKSSAYLYSYSRLQSFDSCFQEMESVVPFITFFYAACESFLDLPPGPVTLWLHVDLCSLAYHEAQVNPEVPLRQADLDFPQDLFCRALQEYQSSHTKKTSTEAGLFDWNRPLCHQLGLKEELVTHLSFGSRFSRISLWTGFTKPIKTG